MASWASEAHPAWLAIEVLILEGPQRTGPVAREVKFGLRLHYQQTHQRFLLRYDEQIIYS